MRRDTVSFGDSEDKASMPRDVSSDSDLDLRSEELCFALML